MSAAQTCAVGIDTTFNLLYRLNALIAQLTFKSILILLLGHYKNAIAQKMRLSRFSRFFSFMRKNSLFLEKLRFCIKRVFGMKIIVFSGFL